MNRLEVQGGQRLQHGGGVGRGDCVHVRFGGRADHLNDALDLIHGGSAREDRAAVDHLPQNSSNSPYVHSSGVQSGAQQNF